MNVNVFHRDVGRAFEISEVAMLLMDDAYLSGISFVRDTEPKLMAQGKYLRFVNLRYGFTIDSSHYSFDAQTLEFKVLI